MSKLVNVTLNSSNWVKVDGKDIWTQLINNAGITDGMQIIPALDDDNTELVNNDGVQIKFDNIDGAAVAKAFAKKPTIDITVQLTLVPVEA